MKKDNKGFTLIEMLGVVVLLGILGTIAVAGTSKYLEQSRKKSFLMMSQSIYEAAQNCQVQAKCSVGTYSSNDLIKMGYLTELKNPRSSQPNCTASVLITEVGTSSTEYKEYNYKVSLKCPGIYNNNEKIYNWPEQKNK